MAILKASMVLSIYPSRTGFSFVLFEGPESPFDWGSKEIRCKERDARTLEEIGKLVDRYRPEALVIEDTSAKDARRTKRIRKLYLMLRHFAESEYIDLYRCSKVEVRECFAHVGARTRYEIAKVIAAQIPAFAHRIPRRRKPWMSEDRRQGLFNAAALGIAYFARQTGNAKAA